MRDRLRLITTVLGTSIALPILAHHSMTEFDRSVVTEIQGEIVDVSWRNPHIQMQVETTDENGEAFIWHLEGAAVSSNRRRGLTGDELQVGDRVLIAGWPSTVREGYMQVNNVLPEGGVELLVGGVREPRWAENAVGGAEWFGAGEAAGGRELGIFRVWSQGTRAWFFRPTDAYPLTQAAIAGAAGWDDTADNPMLQCTPPGMPPLMGNPYPVEFIDTNGDIEMRFEEFDAVRTIHVADAEDPNNVARSQFGYSVGRWEGETLVVDTTRINWPYFNRVGVPQSEAVAVNERFTVAPDGGRLNYRMSVTDPATLTEPFVYEGYWVWDPAGQVHLYDCVPEL